jgi:hypothetical protein
MLALITQIFRKDYTDSLGNLSVPLEIAILIAISAVRRPAGRDFSPMKSFHDFVGQIV